VDLASLVTLCLAASPAATPEGLWRAWSFAPQTVVPLAVVLALYLRRLDRMPRWRIACFAAGWAVLVLALVSPLCRLSATLVSAHMVQHVLLVAVAPPLLVLGTGVRFMGAQSTILATLFYGLAIWLWHFPPIYAAVLLDATLHTIAYALLIAASLCFWSAVLHAAPAMRAAPMLFLTILHTGALGALLTFAGRPWYPLLASGAELWGTTPIADQQLAGLIMWVPMGTLYLVAALALTARQLSQHADLAT
jgi:putative membrane protein